MQALRNNRHQTLKELLTANKFAPILQPMKTTNAAPAALSANLAAAQAKRDRAASLAARGMHAVADVLIAQAEKLERAGR